MSYNIVKYKGKSIQIPNSWNELTRRQFIEISKYISKATIDGSANQAETYYTSKCLAIKAILNLSYWDFIRIDSDQFAELIDLVKFLDDEPDLDKQHLPSIRIGFKKFYGPPAKLKTSTFGEFISADSYFTNAAKKGDPNLYYYLAAALYRPKQRSIKKKIRLGTWNGDNRQDFNSRLIERRAEYFKKRMTKKQLWPIVFFYWGFRNTNVLKFENLFEKPSDNVAGEVVGNQYGWAGTLLELSGAKFGNLEETKRTNWLETFVEMSRQIDIEKKRELNRNKG